MSNFTGVTFAQQKVLPSDDAIIRRNILSDGILYGCEFSYSGSTLTMGAGQLLICGRQIRHPSAQNWAVTDATSGFARLVLTVDLTKTASKDVFEQVLDSIQYASSKDGFPSLNQSDVNTIGSVYQIAACTVSLGAGGITGIVDQVGPCEVAGGGGLNFKLVGGLTQPTDPAENTIWVNTDFEVTGYAFSANEPTVPEQGMVWISTDTSSPVSFNALKNNSLEVCPISAAQYISGAWVDVEAKSYQGGEWVEWIPAGALYYNGDEFTDITGGWGLSGNYNRPTHNDTLTKNKNSMVFESHFVAGVGFAGGFLRANNKVNLAGVNSLELTVKSVSLDESGLMYLCVRSDDFANKGNPIASASLTDSENTTFVLDVRTLSDSYFVGVEAGDYGGTVEILQFVAR